MNRSQFDQLAFFCVVGFLLGCMADNSHFYEKATAAEETAFYVLVGIALVARFCFRKDEIKKLELSESELKDQYLIDFMTQCEALDISVLKAIKNPRYSKVFNSIFKRRFGISSRKVDQLRQHVITVFEGGQNA